MYDWQRRCEADGRSECDEFGSVAVMICVAAQMDVDDIVVGDVGVVWVYEPSIDRSKKVAAPTPPSIAELSV